MGRQDVSLKSFSEVTGIIQALDFPRVITFGIPNPQLEAPSALPIPPVAPPRIPVFTRYNSNTPIYPQSPPGAAVVMPGTPTGNNAETTKTIQPILPRNHNLKQTLPPLIPKFDARSPLPKQPASLALDQPAAKRARGGPIEEEAKKESETLTFINRCKGALSGGIKSQSQNAEDYAEKLGLRCIDRFLKKADLRAAVIYEDSKENRMDMENPQETDEAAITVGEEQGRDIEGLEDNEVLIAKQKTDALRESTKKEINELKDLFLLNRDKRLELRRSYRNIQDLR